MSLGERYGVSTPRAEIISHSREWVEYRSSLVPQSIHARWSDPRLVPSELLDIEIKASIGQDGELRVSDMRLWGVVTGDVLEQIDPLELAFKAYLTWLEEPTFRVSKQRLEIDFSASEWTKDASKLGREMELEEVARVYLLSPTRGTQNVMETLGYGSKTTAIRRVMEARKKGLIPPADASKGEYVKALDEIMKRRAS